MSEFTEWCWLVFYLEVDALFWFGVVHIVGGIL